MNKIFLSGRLTKDVTATKSVTKFNIAVNGYEDIVDYFTITTFGNLAENCAKYLVKGQPVTVVGRIHNNNYEDTEGNIVYQDCIIAESVEFGAKPSAEEKKKTSYTRKVI